ncbi:superoxide dismutase family protein [Aquibacillus sp. LR5S19]|uniref:Superoxide dismutase [Cu-Zn] n=1 Tax=Aquibacillus rhizosphaerae TaxID=3051431 RepID=A0ABT7L9K1_9BACI|nr:superoxide dismutase family protein [Aquibacillus sp. LR5S19]MDL4842544.1 superoxide dismutase family protein [Aquibacillus sp. LR5S19]
MKSLLFVSLLLLVACQGQDRSPIEISMYNSSDDSIGKAILSEESDGVKIKISAEGLEPGLHGIHVHENAKCEGPDFKSAGNHYDPNGNEHGLMHPDGAHLGDLPNVEVSADGTIDAELTLSGATLTDGKTSLLKEDGTSLIIHEKQDDGVSQPAGDAGKRMACGVISLDEANQDDAPTDPTETNEEKEE